jgi:hypothetical protein
MSDSGISCLGCCTCGQQSRMEGEKDVEERSNAVLFSCSWRDCELLSSFVTNCSLLSTMAEPVQLATDITIRVLRLQGFEDSSCRPPKPVLSSFRRALNVFCAGRARRSRLKPSTTSTSLNDRYRGTVKMNAPMQSSPAPSPTKFFQLSTSSATRVLFMFHKEVPRAPGNAL